MQPGPGSPDDAVQALEAQVQACHALAQSLNKREGREGEAGAIYKQMAALDDQALALRLAAATPPTAADERAHAAVQPAYCLLHRPGPTWQKLAGRGTTGTSCGDQLRQRALGALVGGALGDAAACGVQWIYSLEALDQLARGRPGLEFFEPPQCPFFDYPPGSSSPYAEQTEVLLGSVVEEGGLDCCRYAGALCASFGPGFGGYRDRSTKSFLRRYASGLLPPATGSPDSQANAFARLPPLVALLAGAARQDLLTAVACMIRVTQDDDVAVAYGCAAALVLEDVVLGASVTAAVAGTVDWLQQQQQQEQEGTAAAAASHAVPVALWGEVALQLLRAAELAPLPPLEAAGILGRNCHLPNSLTTPLQVLLHLEHQRWQQQGGLGEGQQRSTNPELLDAPPQAPPAAPSDASDGHFCLPCSMGSGSACAPPNRQSAAGRAVLAAGMRQQQLRQGPATLPEDAFVEAARLAIRPGGCCASRAGFAAALAGALVGGADKLPAAWTARMTGFDRVQQLAQQLVNLRD